MAKLKNSEKVALWSVAGGAVAIAVIDWFTGSLLSFWPSIFIGCAAAAGFYSAGLKMQAQKTIIDEMPKKR